LRRVNDATLAPLDIDGPVLYIRLGSRVEEPPVTVPEAPLRLGQATQLRAGNDVAVITCGCMVEMAVCASRALTGEGIGVRVLKCTPSNRLTATPSPRRRLRHGGIVTTEEHHLTGGLGGAVAERLAVAHPTRMRLVGMPDDFAVVGPTVPLRAKYGMSAEAIAAACRSLLNRA